MSGYAAHTITKRLSARTHAAILRRVQERDRHALLVEALNQSIERTIEQELRVSLDKQTWELDLEAGTVSRTVVLKRTSDA